MGNPWRCRLQIIPIHFPSLPFFPTFTSLDKDLLALIEATIAYLDVLTQSCISESEKLHQDLQKVEQLEEKITREVDSLRADIQRMETELVVYKDLDRLKDEAEAKKKV